MNLTNDFHILAATGLLMLACWFDVKSGKFPNSLFIASFALSLIFTFCFRMDLSSAIIHLAQSLAFFVLLTPFVFLRAFGAGDIKLMSVFCLLTSFSTSLSVVVYSLAWGLLIGLLRLALSGELVTFTQSLLLKTPQAHNHKIPYTVALFLGWMSFLSSGGVA